MLRILGEAGDRHFISAPQYCFHKGSIYKQHPVLWKDSCVLCLSWREKQGEWPSFPRCVLHKSRKRRCVLVGHVTPALPRLPQSPSLPNHAQNGAGQKDELEEQPLLVKCVWTFLGTQANTHGVHPCLTALSAGRLRLPFAKPRKRLEASGSRGFASVSLSVSSLSSAIMCLWVCLCVCLSAWVCVPARISMCVHETVLPQNRKRNKEEPLALSPSRPQLLEQAGPGA